MCFPSCHGHRYSSYQNGNRHLYFRISVLRSPAGAVFANTTRLEAVLPESFQDFTACGKTTSLIKMVPHASPTQNYAHGSLTKAEKFLTSWGNYNLANLHLLSMVPSWVLMLTFGKVPFKHHDLTQNSSGTYCLTPSLIVPQQVHVSLPSGTYLFANTSLKADNRHGDRRGTE